MGNIIRHLAEIQAQLTEIRELAGTLPAVEAESYYWLADQLEARAREIDASA
jgi:hypothetical protein